MKRPLSTVIIGALFLMLITLISIQFVSYDWVSNKVSALTNDHHALSWNLELFNQIRLNATFAILFLTGVIIFLIKNLSALKRWTNDIGYFSIKQLHNAINIFKNHSFNRNITLLVIIVIAGFARFIISNESITYDEAFSVNQYVNSSFLNIISNYNYPNNHVFYNLVNKILTTFTGSQEWSIRLPAFIAGMLCLPLLYILGIQLYNNKNKATFLVALFAFSPLIIEYSVQARGYAFIWLFSILSLVSLNAYLKTKEIRYMTLFVIFISLAMWTIPVAIIPFIALVLYLSNKKGVLFSLKISLITLVATALLYLPILLIYGLNLSSKINLGIEESYARLLSFHLEHGLNDVYYNFIMTKPFYFGFISILFILSILKKSRFNYWFLFLGAAITIMIVFQKSIPPSRVWSVILFLLYIPMSDGIGEFINQKKYSYVLFIPLIMLIIQVFYNQKKTFIMNDFRYDNAETIVSRISEPCSIVCQFPMEAPTQYYWSEYLRDKADFNVKSSNTLIAVSTKHHQNIVEICEQWEIEISLVELIEEGDTFEIYQFNAQTK